MIGRQQKNPNVKRTSQLAINFTDDFKNIFIDEYFGGKIPRQIFIDHGLHVELIGMKRIELDSYRWKNA